MSSIRIALRLAATALGLAGITGLAACTLEGQGAPSLAGPSEFGLSLSTSASPDQLFRNGVAQSTVTITTIGDDGKPVAGQQIALSVGTGAEGVLPELVKLSTDVVTAGSDGRATFAVVAPPGSSTGDHIYVQMRPIGTNAGNTSPRSFSLGVYPSNPTPPSADIQGPDTALVGETVVFDASGSKDGNLSCQETACTFTWDFGDGSGGSGMVVRKAYTLSGRYVVQLTVTDVVGAQSIKTKSITVTDLAAATLTVSPNPPVTNQGASFAVALTVPAGVRIDRYEWDWGDGQTQTTTAQTATHTYTNTTARTVTVRIIGTSGETLSTGILSFTPVVPAP